jgi:hypothetical protein
VIDLGFAETCTEPTRALQIESGFFSGVVLCPGIARSISLSLCRLGRQPERFPTPQVTSGSSSKSERDTPEWRLAVQLLIDAAEDRGPMMFAKMGIIKAIDCNVERVSPDRKDRLGAGAS